MRFFLGVACGLLLMVVAAFVADSLTTTAGPSGAQSQNMVNWDVASQRLDRSFEILRESLHKLTG
jgi:hypothetical protein